MKNDNKDTKQIQDPTDKAVPSDLSDHDERDEGLAVEKHWDQESKDALAKAEQHLAEFKKCMMVQYQTTRYNPMIKSKILKNCMYYYNNWASCREIGYSFYKLPFNSLVQLKEALYQLQLIKLSLFSIIL